ncbi:hypothetical protein AAG906_002308 [Vitis piasezkii]
MKKAMMATWSESEKSSEEENEKEVANMYFIAIDDLDEVNSNFSDEDIHDVLKNYMRILKNLV